MALAKSAATAAPTLGVVANQQMREHWTNRAGPAWSVNHDIFTAVFRPVSTAVIAAAEPLAGCVALDVGCGTGGLSRLVADRGARPVGADISASMIDGARKRYPDLRFEVIDVQDGDLATLARGGFDRVVSEFGVMFFDDPVAAFANIAAAVRPQAKMAFACWRSLAENQTFTLGTHLLAERMPDPPPPPTPHQPGPTAFADDSYLARVLEAAGWVDVDIAGLDVDLRFGINGTDGVEERLAVILSGMTGVLATEQLRPALGDEGWEALLDDVRAELRTSMVDGAVQFPGCIWLVRAASAA
jgi:SAM-dependent methyltransferase